MLASLLCLPLKILMHYRGLQVCLVKGRHTYKHICVYLNLGTSLHTTAKREVGE